MKSNERWIHGSAEFEKIPRVEWITFFDCNVGEGDDDSTENTVSSSVYVDNIETEGTGTVSSAVRGCDTDVSYQNKTDDLDLAKIPKVFIELNSRMDYFGKAL